MKKETKTAAVPKTAEPLFRRYTIQQAASLTGISASTIRRACLAGSMSFMRVSGSCNSPILIAAEELQAWLTRCEQNRAVLSPSEVKAMRADVPENGA